MLKAIKRLFILFLLIIYWGCNTQRSDERAIVPPQPDVEVQTQNFKDYWYAGEAELNHYNLEQIRYGEVRDGSAMLVFVTEDFLTDKQVKLESPANGRDTETVLKLNFLKEFVTGIYKYKVMTSTFTPVNVNENSRSLKVSSSSQEWCGVTYSQLNLREGQYDVTGHSYFEDEADYETTLNATWLEDELWTKLRLSPKLLPEGEINIIPGSFAVRSSHSGWSVQQAVAQKEQWSGSSMPGDSLIAYSIDYTNRNRSLTIVYERESPYRIAGWVERQQTSDGDTLEAHSVRTHTIKQPYWKQNANADEDLREKLGFE